jgi:hypothetical protein
LFRFGHIGEVLLGGLKVDWRAGLAISAVIAVVVSLIAVASTRPTPTAGRRGVGGDRTDYGDTILISRALVLIRDCECPGLSAVGRASVSDVVRAWEKDEDFGFVFQGGMTLSYETTSESPEGFLKRIERSIADPDESGPIGRLIPLRNTEAWVKERDGHGPAFVEWVEAGRELTLIGRDDQSLSDLLEVAATLTRVESGA